MLAYILGFSQTAFQKWKSMDFPGGPVVKTLSFQCRGIGLIPGPGTKIPHAVQDSKKKKKKKPLKNSHVETLVLWQPHAKS